jgi:hypothetical protein
MLLEREGEGDLSKGSSTSPLRINCSRLRPPYVPFVVAFLARGLGVHFESGGKGVRELEAWILPLLSPPVGVLVGEEAGKLVLWMLVEPTW